MVKDSFSISLVLAIILSMVGAGIFYMVNDPGFTNLIIGFILLLIGNLVVLVLVFEFLIYHQVRSLINLFKHLKTERLQEIHVDKGIYRLPIFSKLFKRAFRHFYRVEKKVDELTQVAAFRKEFIADVSHELKTPIFAAQGFVHTLLDGAVEDKAVRTKFLQKAAKSLDGLDLLVHDLLILSHIETGETRMHFEYFDLRSLVAEVVEQFEKRAEDKKIELDVTSMNKPLIVYADWLRIKQVLNNLISNAIKYSHSNSTIAINFKYGEDQAIIEVKDSGEGIPNSDLKRIFERFYRVDKSRSREKGGTGLGLAIVKHILEGHNSSIEVESELGSGSTFRFTLPRGKE